MKVLLSAKYSGRSGILGGEVIRIPFPSRIKAKAKFAVGIALKELPRKYLRSPIQRVVYRFP